MKPTLKEQLAAAQGVSSMHEGVEAMNALVTAPCQPKPRSPWRLGLRPRQHRTDDITYVLNTMTYTTLGRCRDCGFCFLESGL